MTITFNDIVLNNNPKVFANMVKLKAQFMNNTQLIVVNKKNKKITKAKTHAKRAKHKIKNFKRNKIKFKTTYKKKLKTKRLKSNNKRFTKKLKKCRKFKRKKKKTKPLTLLNPKYFLRNIKGKKLKKRQRRKLKIVFLNNRLKFKRKTKKLKNGFQSIN